MVASIEEFFGVLDEWADKTPGQLALASRGGFMNYADFVGNIASATVQALQAGVRPGQLIVVGVGNPDMALILALALMRIGCRVGYVRDLELYDSSGVAVDAVIVEPEATPSGHRTITIGPEWFAGSQARSISLPPPATSFSVIVTSSGSTGRPKLIEKPETVILRGAGFRTRYYFYCRRPRVLSLFGVRGTSKLYDDLGALIEGGTSLRTPDRSGPAVVDTIQLFLPDYMSMMPALLASLLQHLETKPTLIRKALSIRVGGAYCSPVLRRRALDLISEDVITVYGSNETGNLAWGRSRELPEIDNWVGKLFDDVEMGAFDKDGQRLADGNEGEIRAKPPGEGSGFYIGRHAKAPNAFKDGWFRTGDIGVVDENRNLIILGRATNVINAGGSKVSPEVLENHLQTMPGIVDVGVAGFPVPEGYEKICAVVVGDSRPSVDEVNAYLVQRREFARVHAVKSVAAIPRTRNGKIDRAALKRLCAG